MNGTKFSFLLFLLLAHFAGKIAIAQQTGEQDEPAPEEMAEFLDLLQQQTTLATTNRLNADFVPGIVSALNAEQMKRRGFRTLWEALATLPGVRATMDETGMRSISVRGVGGLFETSKVKLLLNGKALNASASATTGTIYDTPVDQIERVELIRGPGSAVHGEFAYAGVLNVITRQRGQQYSLGADSDGGADLAALYSYEDRADDFRASINFAFSNTPGQDIDSGEDSSPPGVAGYAPGPINNKRDFVSAILGVESGSLSGLLQLQQGNRGDHFGTSNLLPPDKKQTVISDTVISADISQNFRVDEQFRGDWSLSLLRNSTEQNQLFLGTAENYGGLGSEDDIVSDGLLEEQRIEGRVRLQYALERHDLMAEVVLANLEVTSSERFINLDPASGLPSGSMNEFPVLVDESEQRRLASLVLQDEFHIGDRSTLTTGLRFDDYEDIGSNLSPRISLVWRQSDQQIFKAQLARAFRPPSLIETSGSVKSSIDAETNDTIEFGHIYNDAGLVLRNTLYYSRLENLIMFQETPPYGYINGDSYSVRGYELEVEKDIAHRWQLVGSLSLQDYVGKALPGAAPWMIKLGAGYELGALTSVHLQLNSIAGRERGNGDARDDFEQTNRLDLSLQSRNLGDVGGLDLRAGISNLLDEQLKHPAPADTYPDDYPYSAGATLWLQLSYQP